MLYRLQIRMSQDPRNCLDRYILLRVIIVAKALSCDMEICILVIQDRKRRKKKFEIMVKNSKIALFH
jgi:hypothetical protein